MWKLHYYQWAMQIFEQYGMSEGASQFALAALEQVDAIVGVGDGDEADYGLPEPATTIRGRLWSNVFKYALDLKHFKDAYCAIVSNTDDDSKYICLRRFVIVLCELGAIKVVFILYIYSLCVYEHFYSLDYLIICIKSIPVMNIKFFRYAALRCY